MRFAAGVLHCGWYASMPRCCSCASLWARFIVGMLTVGKNASLWVMRFALAKNWKLLQVVGFCVTYERFLLALKRLM